MKKILQLILKILAKLILAKYRPEVVGITGSVGKTSSKEAIALVLAGKFRVRASSKNYNNEIGLPLTIIGALSAGHSLAGWLAIFIQALKLLLKKTADYPQILVLEMGVDKPGDMDYLNSIVKPKVAVLTMLGVSHLEKFGTLSKLREEKKKIFDQLDKSGYAVLNYSDDKINQLAADLKHKIISYGFNGGADVVAQNIIFKFKEGGGYAALSGINFKISYKDAYIPVLLPRVISRSAVAAALAAFAVGVAYGLNPVDIANSLGEFEPPKGRMNLIPGFNGSIIIDDTYNASPQSAAAALEILDEIPLAHPNHKWVVAGDMLELGEASEEGHLEMGRQVARIKRVRLLTIGQEALYIGIGARNNKLAEEHIQHFNNHQEIIDFLTDKLVSGDIVLLKGSQGMRLEKVVVGIMAEPERAKELLVRQGEEWQ